MNPRVKAVTALPGLVLDLAFVDGRRALFDVAPFVVYPVFECLKDPAVFKQAVVRHGTVAWPGGIDFDPDTLYLDSRTSVV
nr:DUF2442 domain-containing protein [uncultured Albidiferax sp.]